MPVIVQHNVLKADLPIHTTHRNTTFTKIHFYQHKTYANSLQHSSAVYSCKGKCACAWHVDLIWIRNIAPFPPCSLIGIYFIIQNRIKIEPVFSPKNTHANTYIYTQKEVAYHYILQQAKGIPSLLVLLSERCVLQNNGWSYLLFFF